MVNSRRDEGDEMKLFPIEERQAVVSEIENIRISLEMIVTKRALSENERNRIYIIIDDLREMEKP